MSDERPASGEVSQHKVNRLDWRLIFDAPPDAPEETEAALVEYFSRFAEPNWSAEQPHPCLNCGHAHCGFVFGIVTGAGHCKECGWPARRDHDASGIISFRNVVLQYHPDFVIESEKPDPFTGFRYRLKKETAA